MYSLRFKLYTNYTLNLTQNLTVFRRAGDRLVTGGFSEEGGMRSEMSRECHQEVTEAMLSVCGSRRHLRGRTALQADTEGVPCCPGALPPVTHSTAFQAKILPPSLPLFDF